MPFPLVAIKAATHAAPHVVRFMPVAREAAQQVVNKALPIVLGGMGANKLATSHSALSDTVPPLSAFSESPKVGKLFKSNDSEPGEGSQDGGGGGKDSNGSSPDPGSPEGIASLLLVGGGVVQGLEIYLRDNKEPSALGVFGSVLMGGAVGLMPASVAAAKGGAGIALMSGLLGGAATIRKINQTRWKDEKLDGMEFIGAAGLGFGLGAAAGIVHPLLGVAAMATSMSVLNSGYPGITGSETHTERSARKERER